MFDTLSSAQRLQLMKFVCAFAWADLDVSGEEKLFVADCIRRLRFTDAEKKQVWGWLEVPPAPEEIDPSDIPAAHRQAFIEAIGKLVAADDQITSREREALVLFSQLMM
ncbi:MAG TPA: TerB family tellurite resistance protein [Gammaproteobacteria bacterium]|nr:TerB family tellurite resistance protein [Gammaproteobacteria bacterium]